MMMKNHGIGRRVIVTCFMIIKAISITTDIRFFLFQRDSSKSIDGG